MRVIRESETRLFLEGPEVCREYFRTGKITFGSSTLLPGQTGAIDPGHASSHEVFFVSRGHVLLRNPEDGACYELREGDAVIIPEGRPHELTNIGMEKAIITWSAAPSPA
ncbi:MAG: cupin domain-containing protein [Chloroflexi bacterium]|nr:cupin domain-containing protein [Chloroflexota bacterium]